MNYPAEVVVQTPERMANWRPLVQWLLAIPHLLIAGAMSYVANALAIVSWFSILFTGRLPAGIAKFQIMTLRYDLRARTYALFLYDTYPPFEFQMTAEEPGGSPVDLAVTPALDDRNRLTVLLRLIWVIPALIFSLLISIVGVICLVLGFFAVLFTGRWPNALRSWVMAMVRVDVRVRAYGSLLTDEYPPFSTA